MLDVLEVSFQATDLPQLLEACFAAHLDHPVKSWPAPAEMLVMLITHEEDAGQGGTEMD